MCVGMGCRVGMRWWGCGDVDGGVSVCLFYYDDYDYNMFH